MRNNYLNFAFLFVCFCFSLGMGAQGVSITGKVTSANDGSILPGVNIIIVGAINGTTTDFDGKYSILAKKGDILEFSYTGMKTVNITILENTLIDVSLQEDAALLDEVIVVGYGTVKKSDLTGSVTNIGEKDLTAYPSANALQAIQGRGAGVTIQSINGEPGGDFKIRVRGSTSINADSNPLFVVDGLVGGTMPSSEDIASIEVLKDASATAIYGSRGANGVVMVTSKSGKEGKTKVNFNSYYSYQKEIGRLDVLNSLDFAKYINEARGTNFYDLNNLKADTNWQELIFQNGFTNNYQVSVSGGGDKINYYVSGIYNTQDGVIKTSGFNRFSLTSNLKFEVNDYINVSLNTSIRRSNKDGLLTQTSGGSTNSGVITSAQRFDPTLGIVDENGKYTQSQVGIAAYENPLAGIDGRDQQISQDDIQANLKAEFKITKGMLFNSTFGGTIINLQNGVYDSQITNLGEISNGLGSLSNSRKSNYLTEQYLTYNFGLGKKNDFVLTAGYSYQNFKNESFTAISSGFLTDALGFWNLGVGTNPKVPSSSFSESEITSFYSRLNYNLNQRYLFTITGRYDGASQFSKGNKWSFFPSGAFSWNISNEEFFNKNNTFSLLKFRSSYGMTGNQAISPYESLSRISSTFFVVNNTSVSSVRPTSIANKDLTWETTSQFNIGLDVGLLNRRINLTTDYYIKKTKDLLFSVPIATFSGFENRLQNLGEIENKGYELEISSKNFIGDFKWATNFNLSQNKNRVVSLPNNLDIIFRNAPNAAGAIENSILRVGEPIGSFYGYVYEGVYQDGDNFISGGAFETTVGGEKFSDLNNDGVLDSNDRKIIGNPNPKFIWGLNNDISFKNFSLNIFFQAYTGVDMLNLVAMEMGRLSGNSNATIDALNRWTPENTNTNIPKATSSRVSRTSSRFVEDGSFIRLKNLSIAYDLSSKLLDKLKIGSARIYLSGQNLLTFTKYSGVDPEVAYASSNVNLGLDYGSFPNTTSYTLGLNIGF